MRFAVRALGPDNRLHSVAVDGADADEAARVVKARGLTAVSIEARDARQAARIAGGAGRFSVLEFSQELVALLQAGLSIVEALEGLAEKEASTTARAVYERLLARLREGQRLSAALRADGGNTFDALLVGVVQAAEGTSDLPRALARYVEHGQRVAVLRGRVVSAAIYPAILVAVGGAVALFLMGYVVPRFALVYQESGRALPWASQALLDAGRWIAAHAGLSAGLTAAVLSGAAGAALAAWRSGRVVQAALLLPVVGQQVRVARLTRLYMTLGMLLEGGIAVRQALQMLRDAALPTLARALDACAQSVAAGTSLSQALEQQGLATPIGLRLLRVGERSGALGPMLTRAAQFHEAQTARAIDRFSRAFEPLLMALIGALVGAIVILLYLPIFDLAGSFG